MYQIWNNLEYKTEEGMITVLKIPRTTCNNVGELQRLLTHIPPETPIGVFLDEYDKITGQIAVSYKPVVLLNDEYYPCSKNRPDEKTQKVFIIS